MAVLGVVSAGWRVLLLVALLGAVGCASKRGPTSIAAAPERTTAPAYEPLDGPPNAVFDVDAIPEPIPRDEPLARYGNHSPYVVFGTRYHVMPQRSGYVERGTASWYGTKFHGRLTSTREPYDMYAFTAAHKTLPLPSYARVTHLGNGRSVVVRINDRGPFVGNRIIDLSYAAAVKIGMHLSGTAPVEVRVLEPGASAEAPKPPAAPRAASGSRFLVQVAAFSERGNALAYRQRLQGAGFKDVRVVSSGAGTHTLHRVRLGPLTQRSDAESLARQLRAQGFGNPQILED